METTPVGEILCEMVGVSSTTSSNQQDTIHQRQSWSSMVEHADYQDLESLLYAVGVQELRQAWT